jgi:hypothetical protein
VDGVRSGAARQAVAWWWEPAAGRVARKGDAVTEAATANLLQCLPHPPASLAHCIVSPDDQEEAGKRTPRRQQKRTGGGQEGFRFHRFILLLQGSYSFPSICL